MKAWILSDPSGDTSSCSLVFANTRGKAKMQVGCSGKLYLSDELGDLDYTDIRVVRAKEFDGLENLPERGLCIKLILNEGWLFYVGDEIYSNQDIEDFKALFHQNGEGMNRDKAKEDEAERGILTE